MKNILLLIFIVFMAQSCKTTKSGCDAYGSNNEIKNDTTIVKVEHCHIEEESYCYYSVDTIFSKK